MSTPALPRGRHAAPREVVRESQRRRMLAAMAEVVGAKGYGPVAVADVIARAGVSRKTFYEHFENKEECFLAAYDAGVELMLGAIDAAIADAGSEPLAIARAGTARYLETLAANPAFARTFLVEVLAAGRRALERRARVHARFAEQLATIHRAASGGGRADPPPHVFRACVGAIHELVTDHLLRHCAETLPSLLDALVEVEAALLLDPPHARP
jgi:AcrR family transcriptional regulator